MAFGTIEDDTSSIDLVIFPKLFAEKPSFWETDRPLIITGRIDNRDDKASIVVEKAEPIDPNATVPEGANIEIDIPRGTPTEKLKEINQALKDSPGSDQITIVIPNGGAPKKIVLPFTVNYSSVLAQKIDRLLK